MNTTEVILVKAATMFVLGATHKEIAIDLGITPQKVAKILNSEDAQKYIRELGDKALSEAKTKIREQTAMLVPEIINTLRAHLKDKNLNALPHALKILGFNDEEKTQQATAITVVMPGADTIDITPKGE